MKRATIACTSTATLGRDGYDTEKRLASLKGSARLEVSYVGGVYPLFPAWWYYQAFLRCPLDKIRNGLPVFLHFVSHVLVFVSHSIRFFFFPKFLSARCCVCMYSTCKSNMWKNSCCSCVLWRISFSALTHSWSLLRYQWCWWWMIATIGVRRAACCTNRFCGGKKRLS